MTESLLHKAVLLLAGHCDGANQRDDVGFNRMDVALGHSLANSPFEAWTPGQKRAAWKMLKKYRAQLLGYGINYDAIPEPPTPSQDGTVYLAPDGIKISVPYSADLVAEIRNIPDRKWDGASKKWILPATPGHALSVVAFACGHGLHCDENILALARQSAASQTELGQTIKRNLLPGRTVTIGKDQILIRFPFNERMVEAVKEIPGRKWEKEEKAWSIPLTVDALAKVKEFVKVYGFTGDTDKVADLAGKMEVFAQESIEASKAASAEIEVEGLGGTLRPFQKAGVKYATEKLRVIFGDEMGLGKTIEALATLQALSAYPALVICPASLKHVWYNETRKWLPGKTIQMLGTETVGRADANITIINYDQLKQYRDYLTQRDFKAVICDESHYLKSSKSLRTQFTEEIFNGCIYERTPKGRLNRRTKEQLRSPIDVRLLLSGTPLLNRPDELVSQLQILDRLREFGGWYGFMRDFCSLSYGRFGMDTSGAKNLKELNDRLRASCYIRRLKSEVLKELPPKQRTVVPTELTNRAEYDRAERNLIAWLRETAGVEKADAAARAEQLVRIEALKQLAARGKMVAIKEWVEDFLDTDQKLVLFGWHQEIVIDLARTFHCDALYGGTPADKRQGMVDRFQEDPTVKLLAANVQTGGVGLTLTAASNVLFCELGWNPGTMNQASDRCHRIGQKDNVMEWWFIGRKTIDEDIQSLIESKRAVVNAATDGTERAEEVSVLNELVARLRGEEYRAKSTTPNREDPLELF